MPPEEIRSPSPPDGEMRGEEKKMSNYRSFVALFHWADGIQSPEIVVNTETQEGGLMVAERVAEKMLLQPLFKERGFRVVDMLSWWWYYDPTTKEVVGGYSNSPSESHYKDLAGKKPDPLLLFRQAGAGPDGFTQGWYRMRGTHQWGFPEIRNGEPNEPFASRRQQDSWTTDVAAQHGSAVSASLNNVFGG